MAVTNREQQMLDLSADGLTHREIADRMGITFNTVRKTIAYLNTGLGIDHRHERAMIAASARLSARVVEMGGHR